MHGAVHAISTTPPILLLGEAAERKYDHPSLTSPFVGEEKSFSPKLGEMAQSAREVCCFIVDRRPSTDNRLPTTVYRQPSTANRRPSAYPSAYGTSPTLGEEKSSILNSQFSIPFLPFLLFLPLNRPHPPVGHPLLT